MKELWNNFKASDPGCRFVDMYHAHHAANRSPMARIAFIGLGIVLVIVGIIALPAPGPGTLVLAFALALLARESLWLAQQMDRFELWLRARWAQFRAR